MKKCLKTLAACVLGAFLAVVAAPCASAQSYTITDLGTLGGASSEALGINASGQIVGDSYTTADNSLHAAAWNNLAIEDLDPFFGSDALGVAYSINDSGHTAGVVTQSSVWHAALWTKSGGPQDISPTYHYGAAHAINASGQLAGYVSANESSPLVAAYWPDSHSVKVLPTLGAPAAVALGINNAGQVVGQSQIPATLYTTHAFLWSEAAGIRDLGTLGSGSSTAASVNNAGQVVGWSEISQPSGTRAFSWTSAGGMHNLGSLGGYASEAYAINDSGTVVGWSYLADDYTLHAFVWTSSGGMQDLNDLIPANSGWTLTYANAINAAGEIVGSGIVNNLTHAFLLTPSK